MMKQAVSNEIKNLYQTVVLYEYSENTLVFMRIVNCRVRDTESGVDLGLS